MRRVRAMSARLAALLMAIAAVCGPASAQINAVTCRGPQRSIIVENGGCPGNCFDDPANQVVPPRIPGEPWVVRITQCIKDFGAISFISWGEPGPDGECDKFDPCTSKVEEVSPGSTFVDLEVPYGECTGNPICVYVHDGQLARGDGGTPLDNVPESCFSSSNQLCEMCGPFLVTPKLTEGACIDPYSCTTGDACTVNSECKPDTYDASLCDDGIACTGDVCVADRDPAALGVQPADLLADGSGCGYKATDVPEDSCDDGFSCTNDLCVELPSVAQNDAPADAEGDATTGCFFEKVNSQCPVLSNCAVATCVAANPLQPPGTGCTYSEKDVGGEGFCAAKYGDCAAAVCVGADGKSAYEGGTTDDDGCSIRPQPAADATCPSPPDCGEAKCDLDAGVTGSGCFINSGPDFDTVCEAKKPFPCQSASCEADTGVCKFAANNAACNDGFSCTEDICLAGADAAAAGINPVDVDDASGCGYKEKAGVCNDGYSCTTDKCTALTSVTSEAAQDPATGCTIEKNAADCSQSVRECAVATCVAAAPLPTGGDGCTYTERSEGGEGFCEGNYPPCAAAVCADADGVQEYPSGSTNADGCSVRPAAVASADCTQPECGSAVCNTASLDDGGGCSTTAGPTPANNAICAEKVADCQISTCTDGGSCTAPEPRANFCEDSDQSGFGPFGSCVTVSCQPDIASHASGCATTAVTPDPCPAEIAGGCGTSTCDTSTGNCAKTDEPQPGECPGCSECMSNVCVGPGTCDSTACDTCDNSQSPPVCTNAPCPDCSPACGPCQTCDKTNDPLNPTCSGPDPCPDCSPACGPCQTCDKTNDPLNPTCTGGPCPSDCPEPCTGCQICDTNADPPSCTDSATMVYDMVCYKCGASLNCAVMAADGDFDAGAIQAAVKADCDANTGKTCQNQLCKDDLFVYGSETCFPYAGPANGLQGNCPCDSNGVSNYAGYKVTVPGGPTCGPASVSCSGAITIKCEAGSCTNDFGDQTCSVPDPGNCGTGFNLG